jgi:transmembrane sensor
MKEKVNIENFNDKEWEELASILSDEKYCNDDLLSRFNAGDNNKSEKEWKDIGMINDKREINVDGAWNKVYARLDKNEITKSGNLSKLFILRSEFIRIAAVSLVIIALGLTALYFKNNGLSFSDIRVATGSNEKNILVNLPDGSIITLNRNSELSYSKKFGKKSRKVNIKGEGFFDIAHDPANPFIVDAGGATIKVLGTKFNVITKNSSFEVEVFVTNGKVMLSNSSGSKSLLIEPGFVGKIGEENSEKINNEDPNYMAWNTGQLVYNGQKLSVVFNDLKKVYNIDIVADDPIIAGEQWTTPSIDNQSEETIIQLICLSFNLDFKKDGSIYHLKKK